MTLIATPSSSTSNFPRSSCSKYAQYILMLKGLCSHCWYEWMGQERLISVLPFCHSISDLTKIFEDVFSDIFEHDWAIMVCQSIPLCSWHHFVWKVRVMENLFILYLLLLRGVSKVQYMANVQNYVWWFRQENMFCLFFFFFSLISESMHL